MEREEGKKQGNDEKEENEKTQPLDIENKKEKAQFKAELQAETLLEQESRSKAVEELRDEITGLREMIDDIALMPQPRGPQGRAGRDGVDGKDGTVLDLSEAELADLG